MNSTRIRVAVAAAGLLTSAAAAQPGALPTLTVTADDTVIDKSCRVVIVAGRVIPDANGDGVLHVAADDIVIEFMGGATLQGADAATPPDQLTGIGIRIDGWKNITLKNARVRGFKVGVHASKCPGLVVEGGEVSDNFRQRLRSTASGEDGADWLWPHKNDANEWMTNYGGGLVVEDSDGVTIRGVKARRGQNGIILDRVNDSKIYDNDCSFLSGWGLAMWRSNRNTVSRNALDFCVRGHVEGVYNRGQDSAGILFFEQNCNNVIAENSVTHGGDGFFAFAGLEALNGEGAPPGYDHTRKGCNDNLLIDNDFSYAPAHGIELTFSFGNKLLRNRLVQNAICGVWGGYSQDTLIAGNTIEGNGGMGYGLERGGVNIEHGANNVIIDNAFVNNRCGVHLWWDGHGDFAEKTWGKANYKGVTGNVVAGNRFEVNDAHPFVSPPLRPDAKLIGLHLRDDETGNVRGTIYANNTASLNLPQAVEIDARNRIEIIRQGATPAYDIPKYEVYGTTKPVGARALLRGREKIIMTEWGPWDHQSPLIRLVSSAGGADTYEAHRLPPNSFKMTGRGVKMKVEPGEAGGPSRVVLTAATPGVHAYTLTVTAGRDFKQEIKRTILNTQWDASFFSWPRPDPPLDADKVPRVPPDLDAWRGLASSGDAARVKLGALRFSYGGRGPADLIDDPAIRAAGLKADYFGMIARASMPLTKGKWRVRTRSDDGIRVLMDGHAIIEDWTHHGTTPHDAEFEIDSDRSVEFVVEHFEIFGGAALEFELEPVK